MKIRFSLLIVTATLYLFMSCATNSVARVDSDTQIDLSGYWNDTDVRIVCETLITDCLNSARIKQLAAEKGRRPVIVVGTFRNLSLEHLDTSIISKRMATAILDSGIADFVASGSEREELREERAEQLMWASDGTAKEYANETAADFYLTGSVNAIEDREGNRVVKTYFVYAELTDIESNMKIWIGENDSIKKVVTKARIKP